MNLGKLKLAANPVAAKEQADESAPVVVPETKSVAPSIGGLRLGGLKLGGSKPTASVPAIATKIPDAEVAEESKAAAGTPEGFLAMLNRLDELIVAGEGVTALTLDTCRKYVGEIYRELKVNPNLDPIFKDRDMHNVMAVVQRSTIQAQKVIVEKKVKSETRAAKAGKINTSFGIDFGDFGGTGNVATQVAVGKAGAIEAVDPFGFADINTDEIAAQVQRAKKK